MWARESIEDLASRGIVSGAGEGIFLPDNHVKREEFIKILMLTFGLTDKNAKCSFSDVKEGQWYYIYIASAEKIGISKGKDDMTFGIGQDITREEMAVFVDRTVKYVNLTLPKKRTKQEFDDSSEIGSYAEESIYKMQQAGIINGMDEGKFAPKQNATRAQSTKIIFELINAIP